MEEKNRQETILLVDDTFATIKMVKAALEEKGYEVLVATSGEKAIKRAALTMPDLIVLDILMPGMDGYDTCRHLKANAATAAIPVIFMSALTDTFDKVTGFTAGAVDYVVKPIETEELFARVRTHLTISRLQRALKEANVRLEERILARTEELRQSNARLREEISERRQAEEQIKNQNILLEQAVQEKQQEMEVLFDRLLRQEKLATIGQMAGSIAHELRNPLGAVKNSVFYLKRLHQKHTLDASNPKVEEYLNLIEEELNISEEVIAYLLKMTRMGQIKREHTHLRPLIEDAVQRTQIPESVRMDMALDDEPFLIWADPLQLRQVLINLLTNAKQAIEGEGRITIGATQVTKDASIVIEIEDTGAGIKPEAFDKVFEPLYTTKAIGTGLGLSICKQIIENHQGQIRVRSSAGQGTTMTIVLPNNDRRFAE